MTQTVLVTGAAGYVGSILCEHLLDAGFKVRALDRMFFEPSLFHLCANPDFDFILGDARDEKLITEALKGVDVIIPLAAIVGAPACKRDPDMATSLNLDAVKMITRLRKPDQLIVYPTTNSGYGTKSGEHCVSY